MSEIVKAADLTYAVSWNVFTRLYTFDLLGGEFDNCYGQGRTQEQALNSLRFAVHWRRRKRLDGKKDQIGIGC